MSQTRNPGPCPRCRDRPREYRGYCKPCSNEYRRQYYRDNHEKAKRQVRIDAWKRQGINITWDEYEQLLAEQDGLCAICHQPEPNGRALHVDHDHTTGAIRALLCIHCNTTLGAAQENPDLLHKMAEYLQTHQESPVLL